MKKKLLLAVLLHFSFTLACSNQKSKSNVSIPDFIIDSHIHYRATDDWENSFLTIYEKFNAMGCILVGMKDLDRGINFAKAHTERVIPYAAIDIDSPTVLSDIQKVYDMGYKALGELFARNEWNYDDPKYDPIWALAEKTRLASCSSYRNSC